MRFREATGFAVLIAFSGIAGCQIPKEPPKPPATPAPTPNPGPTLIEQATALAAKGKEFILEPPELIKWESQIPDLLAQGRRNEVVHQWIFYNRTNEKLHGVLFDLYRIKSAAGKNWTRELEETFLHLNDAHSQNQKILEDIDKLYGITKEIPASRN